MNPWFKSLRSRLGLPSSPRRPRPWARRPRLLFEALEDRALPTGIVVTGAPAGAPPAVHVYSADTGALLRTLLPFAPGFTGGVAVAAGDVNRDGVADVIAAAGPGGGPHVRVFDGVTWEPLGGSLGGFFAYDPGFRGGINVAVADVNGDGYGDVVTGAGAGGGPDVRAFSGFDGSLIRHFFAYGSGFSGGVDVAAGDLDGDGKAEIVTGAGPGGGPHVKAFDGASGAERASFFAYDAGFGGGVNVAVGDYTGGTPEVITGAGPGGGPHVRVFRATDFAVVDEFYAFDAGRRDGVQVAAGDSADSFDYHSVYYSAEAAGSPLVLDDGINGATALRSLVPASGLTRDIGLGASLGASVGTDTRTHLGLGTIWEGTAANLPRTRRLVEPNATWEVPNTPTPNVSEVFRTTGLPIQTTDWWTPIQVRTTNNPGPNGWVNGSNNNQLYLTPQPTALGLRPNQAQNAQVLQFALGQPLSPAPSFESHFKLGNLPVDGNPFSQNATRQYYNFASAISNNSRLDLQIGVFDQAVPAGPDSTADGSTSPAQRAIPVTNIAVDDYSDWGATLGWSDGKPVSDPQRLAMSATAMTGNPFTYFRTSGNGRVEIYLGKQFPVVPLNSPGVMLTTRVVYENRDDEVLVLGVPQINAQQFPSGMAYYAVFLPTGAEWAFLKGTSPDGQVQFDAKMEINLEGKDYFSIAALPQSAVSGTAGQEVVDPAVLELYRKHAYAFPTTPTAGASGKVGSTEVRPSFNPATGVVSTQYRVYTKLMEAGPAARPNVNASLFALYPHQWTTLDAASAAALAASPAAATYQTAVGTLKVLVPTTAATTDAGVNVASFGTTLTYRGGILPSLPTGIASAADNDTLLKYLEQVAVLPFDTQVFEGSLPGVGNFNSLDDGYFGGKTLLRVANLLPLFDEVTPTATYTQQKITDIRNRMLDQVKRQLVNWLDATDSQFLLYDTVWDTMLAYPNGGFRSVEKNSDKHFFWGYFLKTAALIARYDPHFVSDAQFGPVLTMMAKDAANWDRTDTRFPFLRNFQPYLGHSLADGVGEDENGNNLESASEAMNFNTALVLLGEALMAVGAKDGQALRDVGVYLFTTEEHAIGQSWYNVGNVNFPIDYTNNFDSTTLTANIDATQTTVTVQATTPSTGQPANHPLRLPAVTPFVVQVDRELLLVTGIADGAPVPIQGGAFSLQTYVWTVVRGFEGTTPGNHWVGNANNGTEQFSQAPLTNKVSVKSPLFRNTTLSAAVAAADAQVTVASAAAFPATNGFLVSIGAEVIRVTAGAGTTTWTVTRGVGTLAAAHAAADRVRLVSPTPVSQATIVRTGRIETANFFAGDDASQTSTNYSITWLPVNASSLYHGRYRNADGSLYAASNFAAMQWDETFMYVDDAADPIYKAPAYLVPFGNNVFKGTPGQGGQYAADYWMYQAFSNPQGALAALHTYLLDPATPDLMTKGTRGGFNGLDEGETVAFTFHFISSLAKFGRVDPDVFAVAPTGTDLVASYAAFRDPTTGARTYVAYNSHPTQTRSITFRSTTGGPDVTFDVPALSTVRQAGTDAGTRVTIGPPQGVPVVTVPDNRYFLRADQSLTKESGASENPLVLPFAPGSNGRGGVPAGPDFTPNAPQDRFQNPLNFELRGVSGTPLPNAGVNPTDPRTNFALWVINNLDHNAVDETHSPENGALVIVNVAYFESAAKADAHEPFRVEAFRNGPQFIDASGRVVPAFSAILWKWHQYQGLTWQDGNDNDPNNGAIGNRGLWFHGAYQPMNNGVVRLSVWTFTPNNRQYNDGRPTVPDPEQSKIGIRVGAAANQFMQSYIDIPYTNIQVSEDRR